MNRLLLAVAAASLAACAPVEPEIVNMECPSYGPFIQITAEPTVNCGYLTANIELAQQMIYERLGVSYADQSKYLRGWKLHIHADSVWDVEISGELVTVRGLTRYNTKTIELGYDAPSILHEMLHVMDHAMGTQKPGNKGHEDWEARGWYQWTWDFEKMTNGCRQNNFNSFFFYCRG